MVHHACLGRSHRGHRAGSTLVLILGAVIVAGILVGAVWYFMRGESETAGGPLLYTLARGPFNHIVLEQGEVESSSNIEIRCEVKSRNTSGTQIISVLSEGTQVKKGDLIVKLDSSALERDRDQQQIVCNTSEAIMIQAQNNYEAAQILKIEYLEGTYKQDEELVLSDVFVAEQNLRTTQLQKNSGERLASKGVITALQLEGDEFAVKDAGNRLAAAHTKLKVLQEYTKKRMLKQLDSDIATTNAKWESEKSSYALEKKKLRDIEDQIGKCEIRAPADGQVVYANVQSNRGGGATEFVVEAGANVRENQAIVKLPDPTKMQVKAKVNESRVTLVRSGMPVLIRLDAFGDGEPLKGEVTKVNPYAEPGSWMSSQVKEYGTFIKIFDPPPAIRPGLTAEVRIFVEQREDVLQAPVQAIFEHGGEIYCLVKTSGDKDELKLEPRKLKISATNDKFVAIDTVPGEASSDGVKVGVAEGEILVRDPRSYIAKVTLPKVTDQPKEVLVDNSKKNSVPAAGGTAAGVAQGAGLPSGGTPTVAQSQPEGGTPQGAAPGGPAGGAKGGGAGRRGGGGGGGGGQFDPNQIFAAMDKNGDGKVTADEMADMPEDRRARTMQNDTNGDGAVDREEFMAAMARMRQQFGGGGAPGAGGPPGGQ